MRQTWITKCQLTMESRKAEHRDGPVGPSLPPDRDRTADKMQLQHITIIIIIIAITVNSLGNRPVPQILQKAPLTAILQISKVPTHYNTYFGCSRNLQNSSRIQAIQAAHEDRHTKIQRNRTHIQGAPSKIQMTRARTHSPSEVQY